MSFPTSHKVCWQNLMRCCSISVFILGIVLAHVTVESNTLSSSIRRLLKECLSKLNIDEKESLISSASGHAFA